MFMNKKSMKIIDKIHKIKYSRLKPEEKFLEDKFYNLKEELSDDKPNYISYVLNNEMLFKYDIRENDFWCHYYKIWCVLEFKYSLNYQEITELIKGEVWKHLNLKDVTPRS